MTDWYKYRVTERTTDGKTVTRTVVQISELTAKLAYYCMVEKVIPETRKVICLGREKMPEDVRESRRKVKGLEKVFNPGIIVTRY